MQKYSGVYIVVYKYLRQVREWSEEQADRFLQSKSFSVIIRISNRIVRRRIIARCNFRERGKDGIVRVSDTRTQSSLVRL